MNVKQGVASLLLSYTLKIWYTSYGYTNPKHILIQNDAIANGGTSLQEFYHGRREAGHGILKSVAYV